MSARIINSLTALYRRSQILIYMVFTTLHQNYFCDEFVNLTIESGLFTFFQGRTIVCTTDIALIFFLWEWGSVNVTATFKQSKSTGNKSYPKKYFVWCSTFDVNGDSVINLEMLHFFLQSRVKFWVSWLRSCLTNSVGRNFRKFSIAINYLSWLCLSGFQSLTQRLSGSHNSPC